jgi:rod shape-determining protein MreC
MHHQPVIVRWSMPITIIVLVILSLAPVRWIGWTGWFAAQARVVISPIAHPITIAIDTIIPPPISDPQATQRERTLADERDRLRTELLQIREENHRLSTLIDKFTRGTQIIPNLDVRQVHRPRISSLVGGLLIIRSGEIPGLTQGAVVVADAVQLLGKVSRVDKRTSTVELITARSAQPILAVVLLNKSGSIQVPCLLKAVGDGTLKGEVARTVSDDPNDPDMQTNAWDQLVGKEVRLLDSQWPAHAQMLMIGTIERVERNDAQPLRTRIIVRPTIADLRRVPEVIFRLPPIEHADSGGGS